MQVSESKQHLKVDLHIRNLIGQIRNQSFTKLIAKFHYQRNIWRCAPLYSLSEKSEQLLLSQCNNR